MLIQYTEDKNISLIKDSEKEKNFPDIICSNDYYILKSDENLKLFSKNNILSCFNNQKKAKNLQKSLIGISKETIDYIINELKGQFRAIIKNKTGNYFISNLINICDKNQRYKILVELSNTIYEDCIDEFGNYPIQKLIEFASDENEFQLLLQSFNDYNKIVMASLSKYGAYVIQKLIKQIPENSRKEFNSIIVKLICILSRDIYGVFVLQKFICFTKNELIEKEIIIIVLNNFISLSCHKYGNYFIQFLLEKWWKTRYGNQLKRMIICKYNILIKNNYSSYICELLFKLCNDREKEALISFINNKKNLKDNENNKNSY